MFDDFIVGPQIEEIIPEEYEDWCCWVYNGAFQEEKD